MNELKSEECPVCHLMVNVRNDGWRVPHLWGKNQPQGCSGGFQLSKQEAHQYKELENELKRKSQN